MMYQRQLSKPSAAISAVSREPSPSNRNSLGAGRGVEALVPEWTVAFRDIEEGRVGAGLELLEQGPALGTSRADERCLRVNFRATTDEDIDRRGGVDGVFSVERCAIGQVLVALVADRAGEDLEGGVGRGGIGCDVEVAAVGATCHD